MAAYSTLKAAIQAVIKQNGNNEITGPILQQALLSMINSLGDGYQFKGVATPATNPGTPDQNVFYIASEVGTYSNFGLSVGENEVAVFLWNGSWSKQSTGAASAEAVSQLGQQVIYDVSANNGGATFASLSALLSDENLSSLIPIAVRCGGMSIRFVLTSDNKYVQFRYMSDDATTSTTFTNVANWQGVADKITVGREDLVNSRGLGKMAFECGQKIIDNKDYAQGETIFTASDVKEGDVLHFKCTQGVIRLQTDVQSYIDTEGVYVVPSGFVKAFANPAVVGLTVVSNNIMDNSTLTENLRTLNIENGNVFISNKYVNKDEVIFTSDDIVAGDVVHFDLTSGQILIYVGNTIVKYITASQDYTIPTGFTKAIVYVAVPDLSVYVKSTKKNRELQTEIVALQNRVSENSDDIDSLESDMGQIISKRIINDYPSDASYNAIPNDYTYFITAPIQAGEFVTGIKINAKSAGSIVLNFCKLDFENEKAYLIEQKTLVCTIGENSILFDIPFSAKEQAYIGIQGRNVVGYQNTSAEGYGTINNPLYQVSGNVTTEGVSFTTNSSANFRYSLCVPVYKSIFVTYGKYITEKEADKKYEPIPSFVLDNVNILRYHKADSGEYTLWGRWFDMTVNGVQRKVTNNAGSEIMFEITGASSVVFVFDQVTPNTINPYIAFSIDGGEFTRQQLITDSSLYKATLTLPDTDEHIVRMSIDAISQVDGGYKWNGSNAIALVSITPDAGTMKAIIPFNKIGMFFGDSITEGVNVLGTGGDNDSQSATKAYSYWTTRYLNSIRYCVGYGGSGIFSNGSFKPCIDAINYLKEGVQTEDSYPDYIVVNHGLNDYSLYESDAFCEAYEIVVERLRIKYPGVPIFMVSPFLKSNQTKYQEGMQDLADDYTNVYYIDTIDWDGETTDNTHLSVNGAISNGRKLADAIMAVLGKQFFI